MEFLKKVKVHHSKRTNSPFSLLLFVYFLSHVTSDKDYHGSVTSVADGPSLLLHSSHYLIKVIHCKCVKKKYKNNK